MQVELDVEAADALTENARVAIYQIIRDAVNQAIRRGPPSRISITVAARDDGTMEAVIADDGAGERRRTSFEDIEERARTLSGRLDIEAGEYGGTAVSRGAAVVRGATAEAPLRCRSRTRRGSACASV
jgi:nitrate/nitrite-specific signal transduction histidine kinase